MIRRCTFLMMLLSALASVCSTARAADSGRHAIVLPTDLGGYFLNRDQYRREVSLALEERLRAAQFTVPAREPLSPSEGECHEFDCLQRIAEVHGTDVVIAGRIVNSQQVKVSYHLRVRIVDLVNEKLVTREREEDCANCTEPAARDRLATLMSETLANESSPSPDVPPSAVSTPSPTTRDRLSHGQKVAFRISGIVVGALGLGLLAQGFVELAHDGDLETKNGQRYRVDTSSTGQPLFFTLGAVTLVGGAVLEALGWWHWPVKVEAAASSTGGQMQLSGRF